MSLIQKGKDFLINKLSLNDLCKNSEKLYEIFSQESDEAEEEILNSDIEIFKTRNVILEKLNYLEQYIKIFSLTYPEKYDEFLKRILKQKFEYEEEFQKYMQGFGGNMTFSIDPESEAQRHAEVCLLEKQINEFVDSEVSYNLCKENFSKLCYKLNVFYGALINTKREVLKIENQIRSAVESLVRNIDEMKTLDFFKTDSRKKEDLFNYIIYCDYIIFKSYLRCLKVKEFEDYKCYHSKVRSLFIDSNYDRFIFKFFIEDLEYMQFFITDNLTQDKLYVHILDKCQNLQSPLDNYYEIFNDSKYFDELIRFENTLDNIARNININFSIKLPSILQVDKKEEKRCGVNDIALSILNLIDSNEAKLLYMVISGFKVEILWKELYFICKIFEVYEQFINASSNTIFCNIKSRFTKFEEEYTKYSDSYIQNKKLRVLNYTGSKQKKYILLLTFDEDKSNFIVKTLENLNLDFLVVGNKIYLNNSYFSGFKNLEINFGDYKIF